MKSFRIFTAASILLLSFISLTAMSQSIEQEKTDSVFQLVKQQLNNNQADLLYALTGDDFQKNISPEKFGIFVSSQLFPLGPVQQSAFISFVNNSIATYKLVYSTITLQLLMALDDNDKIRFFQVVPYTKAQSKPALAPTSNPLKTLADKKIDTVARAYIQKANTVGLSIGLFKDGKFYTYNYGETARGNSKLPTANTIYEIGSITKTFTAALLAYDVNQGAVKLSDPITKYLPDSVSANPSLQSITLLTLSNHTSGLPSLPDNLDPQTVDPTNPYKNYTAQMLFAYLQSCKLNAKPGNQYVYSNLGLSLLGIILERVSGKPYAQMLAEIITKPLAMSSTLTHLPPALQPRFATVYNEAGSQTPAWQLNAFTPAGALRSTVTDMLAYAKANMSNDGSKLTKAFALTHQVTFTKDVKIGLAWHVITVNGIPYCFHDGGTGGSSSFLAFNAEKNIAVVVLSNCAESTATLGAGILKKLGQ
jgi:CubicO group peptidase (beta-lactamase class C family)